VDYKESDETFKFTRYAPPPRNLTRSEAVEFLATGNLPDLRYEKPRVSREDAIKFLSGLPSPITAAAEVHTGAMIALVPCDDDLERLTVEGGEPQDQLHLTILYLGEATSFPEDIREKVLDCFSHVAPYIAPFTADGFSVAAFNPTGPEPCQVLMVSGDGLSPVKSMLCETFHQTNALITIPDQHEPWIPHVTLNYSDSTDLTPYRALTGPVLFDKVRLAFGGEIYDYPFGEMLDDLPEDSEDDGEDYSDEYSYSLAFASARGLADPGNAKALHEYWTRNPEGLAKWADKPHPWTALYKHLRKYIKNLNEAKATAAKWFHDVKGYWPGDQKGKNPVGPG
jgi:2'-5' RNA ligase